MSARTLASLAAGLAVAGMSAAGAAAAPGRGAPDLVRAAGSTAVGVGQREFRISLYRREVRPGAVRFNIRNFGEDAHDLVVFAPGTRKPLAASPEILAGRRATLRVTLRRTGSYRLLCLQADHAARGMRARLLVRRSRTAR